MIELFWRHGGLALNTVNCGSLSVHLFSYTESFAPLFLLIVYHS